MAATAMGIGRQSRERRALNMIWTAAGNYQLAPAFVAYLKNGEPDIYFNSIIGLAYREYGYDELETYLMQLSRSFMGAMLLDLFWLGLEHAVLERNAEIIRTLPELRQAWAEDYLDDSVEDSMQYLMMRQEVAHSMKKARCAEVLTGKSGLLNPWEKGLYEKLTFDAGMNLGELEKYFHDIVKKYFFMGPKVLFEPRKWHLTLSTGFSNLLRRFMPLQHGAGVEPSLEQLASMRQRNLGKKDNQALELMGVDGHAEAKDWQKIKELFPRSFISEQERGQLEQLVCTGNHRFSHIYLALPEHGFSASEDAQKTLNQQENRAAYEANCEHFRSNGRKYTLVLHQLMNGLQNSLQLAKAAWEQRAVHGKFAPKFVWQAIKANDERTFECQTEDNYQDFSVVLLLDGSYSRHDQQAVIAAQAYIMAEAMQKSGLPVMVVSYCTVGGYTVLQILKNVHESSQGIFAYRAQGWNRDGLALRTLGALLERQRMPNPLLFVLTDMLPSDERGLPVEGLKVFRKYAEDAALKDTEAELKQLHKAGIDTVGLINTVVPFDPGRAKRLFGQGYIRLERLERLSAAVTEKVDEHIQMLM